MQGCGGGWPGQMVEDLALCSLCLHWFSLLFRGSLLQVAAGLQMLLSDQLKWLIRRGPPENWMCTAPLLIGRFGRIKTGAATFMYRLICYHRSGGSYHMPLESVVEDPCLSAKLCTRVCTMQRIWLLWRRLFAGIAVNSKEILLDLPSHLSRVMSLHVGAHGRIDRALLKKKNPRLGLICTKLMKLRSRRIKRNISSGSAVASNAITAHVILHKIASPPAVE